MADANEKDKPIVGRIHRLTEQHLKALSLFNNATDKENGNYDRMKQVLEENLKRGIFEIITDRATAPKTLDEYLNQLNKDE